MQEHLGLSPRLLEATLFLLGLSGIATLFLPFAYHTSPWDVTVVGSPYREFTLVLLGSPFLLAIPISGASLLLAVRGYLARACWIAGYALGFASLVGTLIIVCEMTFDATQPWHYLDRITFATIAIAGPVAVVLGSWIVIRNGYHGLPHALNGIIAMEVMYVAGAMLPLIAYSSDWDIGAYFTVVTVVVYIAHVALTRRTHPKMAPA